MLSSTLSTTYDLGAIREGGSLLIYYVLWTPSRCDDGVAAAAAAASLLQTSLALCTWRYV